MSTLPYFPFYPADWLSSPKIMCLTLAQQGAYIRLLCVLWQSGDCSIEDNPEKLSMLTGLPIDLVPALGPFLGPHPTKNGFLTNERLMKEWEKAHWISDMRSQSGKKSGKSRRTHVRTHVQHKPEQNANKKGTHADKSEVRSQSHNSDSESEVRSQKKELNTSASPPATAAVWSRYSEAYRARYKTDPVRNATVNSQITALVKRLGGEAAPEVAAFYVWHNDQFYVRNKHPIGLLLKQAEGLHTEWSTGKVVTSSQARKIDETQGRVNVFEELIREREEEEKAHVKIVN